jgi:hypothetical protein
MLWIKWFDTIQNKLHQINVIKYITDFFDLMIVNQGGVTVIK